MRISDWSSDVCSSDLDGRWVDKFWASIAVVSVVWWWYTDNHGVGDLRPYLYVQFMPLLLIPLLHWKNKAPTRERWNFAAAIGLYVLAKASELLDHQIFRSEEHTYELQSLMRITYAGFCLKKK